MQRLLSGVLAILLAATISACTIWKEPKVKTWDNATGPEAFTRLWWQEIQKKDWRAVERRMGPNFVWIIPDAGRMGKADALKLLETVDLQELSLGEFQTAPSQNTAVVTYTAVGKGTAGGKPLPTTPMHVMSIWQDHGEQGWLLIAFMETPVAPTK